MEFTIGILPLNANPPASISATEEFQRTALWSFPFPRRTFTRGEGIPGTGLNLVKEGCYFFPTKRGYFSGGQWTPPLLFERLPINSKRRERRIITHNSFLDGLTSQRGFPVIVTPGTPARPRPCHQEIKPMLDVGPQLLVL